MSNGWLTHSNLTGIDASQLEAGIQPADDGFPAPIADIVPTMGLQPASLV